MRVNSRQYWDQRFHTDWDQLGGVEQTRFFARIALSAMPQWLVARIRSAELDLCDWGCAEGEGAAMLAEALGAKVTGIDFSAEAIAIARTRHAGVEFVVADLLTEGGFPTFDVIFSSNTLEHFHEPWKVFDVLAKQARRYIALLLPYREVDRHPEHFAGFAPADMPVARSGWALVHAAVVDAAALPDSAWPGEQILAIYARPEELESAGVALASLRLDTPQLEACRNEALAAGATLREYSERLAAEQAKAAQFGELKQSLSEISSHLTGMHSGLVDAISSDIVTMQREYARLLESAGELQAVGASQAAQIEALSSSNAKLTVERETLEAERALLNEKVAASVALTAELTVLKAEAQALGEAKRALEAERALLNEKVAASVALTAELTVLKAEAQALGEAKRALEAERALLTEKVAASVALTAELTALKAEAQVLGEAKRALEAERALLTEKVAASVALTAELTALKAEAQALGEAKRALEAERALLDEKFAASAAATAELTAALKAEVQTLSEGALLTTTTNASLARQLEEGRRETSSLRDELTRALSDNKQLNMASTAIANELELARAHLRELEQRIASDSVRIASLERDAADLARIRASRAWRFSKPFRIAWRVLRGYDSVASGRHQLMALAARVVRMLPIPARLKWRMTRSALDGSGAVPLEALPTMAEATMFHMAAPAVAGKADVFVWAVIDWHFRTQRPQHLARALADAGHRVFYISNNFVDSTEPGFSVEPLDKVGRLFQVHLNLAQAPAIYYALPDAEQRDALRRSLAKVVAWAGTTAGLSLIQHPYWTELSWAVPNVRRIYDCMDHHAGFGDNAANLIEAERELVSQSDLVIVTSGWLEDEIRPHARQAVVIRNACEFAFFRDPPENVFRDQAGRKVIGYYGAIAEWFDIALVRQVAEAYPDCLVVLVGADTVRAGEALADLPNVKMVGEVPYRDLPYWLHGFDVCLLPFQVIPLTLATNPVKVYEYLSAGKPVVSVDLPEMAQFHELVRTARTRSGFVAAVGEELAALPGAEHEVRQAYAARQTWAHRAEALDAAIASMQEPKISVVVLTYNNLDFTEACLFSIEHYSDYANLEVIVVDNASTDGSVEFLRDWAAQPSAARHQRRLILNESNLGFAAGNNIGLAASSGEYLVMVNNDTYVTPGWVRSLVAHLRCDPSIGLVGPLTNNIGNEARIAIEYADMVEMIHLSGEYTRQQPGSAFPVEVVAFFCVGMPKTVYEQVGGLDEAFGLGFFEDDDYCRRVKAAGWRIVCAENVFVHHHLSASFDKIGEDKKKDLFDRNKAIYEEKWGAWKPHCYRNSTN